MKLNIKNENKNVIVKNKESPRSHMLTCIKSQLDFNGNMHFAKLKTDV